MNNISGKPQILKEMNKTLIMDYIKLKETATRAEIVHHTNISHTTVRNILKELIEDEEVIILGLDTSSGGRRAERYKINGNKSAIIAATIEDKRIYYRVVNVIGEILSEGNKSLRSKDDMESISEVFNVLIEDFKMIKHIGITVPGIVTDKGYITGLGVDDWKEVLLKEEVEKRFTLPCTLENDLNAVALGYFRNNKESKNMVYLNFTDLGVGAGILINGEILKGERGFAGEVGVLPINNTFLNQIVLEQIEDDIYIDAIVKTIKIISSLLNPKTIVLGGKKFRYRLKDEIIDGYKKGLDIETNIIIDKNEVHYGLLGISETVLHKL